MCPSKKKSAQQVNLINSLPLSSIKNGSIDKVILLYSDLYAYTNISNKNETTKQTKFLHRMQSRKKNNCTRNVNKNVKTSFSIKNIIGFNYYKRLWFLTFCILLQLTNYSRFSKIST